MHRVLLLLVTACFLCQGGCSVVMALEGAKAPDLAVLEIGATRVAVEEELGDTIVEETSEDGDTTTVTYEYRLEDDEPSVVRALAHGFIDVLTWGLWELAGTQIEEAARTCPTEQVTVTYDVDHQVISIAPLPPARKEEEHIAVVDRDLEY